MKKALVLMLAVVFLTGICVTAGAVGPQTDNLTCELIYSFDDKADAPYVHEADGYFFYGGDSDARVNFEGNKMVITDHYNGYLEMRVQVPDDVRNTFNAEKCAPYNAVGFYFENNTSDECGLSWFGETFQGGTNHQNVYQGTEYDEITAYLIDTDGNVTRATEYMEDYGHACSAVPAGFKGWFVLTLDSLGDDYCYYKSFGFHSACDNGAWVSGECGIGNVGVAIYSLWCDEGESFVVDDYILVNLSENFGPTENGGEATPVPVDSAEPQETQDTSAAPGESSQTQDPAGNSFPWVWIVVAAVVVIAVVAAVIIAAKNKNKKAE